MVTVSDVVDLCADRLHVRLLNPTARDVGAVSSRLGVVRGSCPEPPGLVLRFLDRIAIEEPVVPLGDVLVSGTGTVVCGGVQGWSVQPVSRPEDQVSGVEVRCAHGSSTALPLHELAALCTLRRGGLPIHAAAFALDGRGVAVTGRSGAGKTGVVLAHLAREASLVASEHVVVDSGRRMHGRHEAVRLRPHHLAALSEARAVRIPRQDRRRLAQWAVTTRVAAPLLHQRAPVPGRLRDRLARALRDHAWRDVDASLFPNTGSVELSVLLLLLTTSHGTLAVREMTVAETSRRLLHLFREDTVVLRRLRQSVGYVFPDRRFPLLDGASAAYLTAAERMLSGCRLLLVRRPQAMDPARLRDALDRWLGP